MNMQNSPVFDAEAAASFNDRLAGMVDQSAVVLMLSLGHRSGLLQTMAEMPAASSRGIAERSGLAERYVREWLAAMVTGGIVEFDPEGRTYRLPPEHAASLTPDGSLGNLAVYCQFLPMAGAMQERLLHCFATGEGTSYSDYPCFHRVMSEDSGQTVVAQLFDSVLPLEPTLTERLEQGIEVLDAGCGSGLALVALARRFPRSRFTGVDLCADAIASARAEAGGLSNVSFYSADLSDFDRPESFDLITSFDAVHDQKDPQGVLTALWRALRPGGLHLMQDIGGSARLENNLDFPFASFLYAVSCMHCTPVSIGQGGEGLGTMWGWETAEAMLRRAGFAEPKRHVLPHDPMNVWFLSRK